MLPGAGFLVDSFLFPSLNTNLWTAWNSIREMSIRGVRDLPKDGDFDGPAAGVENAKVLAGIY